MSHAPNARARLVTDYEPDPRGAALFCGLTAAIGGVLNGAAAVVAAPQSFAWSAPLQRMTGAASAGKVLAPANPQLAQETTTTDVTTQSIFRSRMARGL